MFKARPIANSLKRFLPTVASGQPLFGRSYSTTHTSAEQYHTEKHSDCKPIASTKHFSTHGTPNFFQAEQEPLPKEHQFSALTANERKAYKSMESGYFWKKDEHKSPVPITELSAKNLQNLNEKLGKLTQDEIKLLAKLQHLPAYFTHDASDWADSIKASKKIIARDFQTRTNHVPNGRHKTSDNIMQNDGFVFATLFWCDDIADDTEHKRHNHFTFSADPLYQKGCTTLFDYHVLERNQAPFYPPQYTDLLENTQHKKTYTNNSATFHFKAKDSDEEKSVTIPFNEQYFFASDIKEGLAKTFVLLLRNYTEADRQAIFAADTSTLANHLNTLLGGVEVKIPAELSLDKNLVHPTQEHLKQFTPSHLEALQARAVDLQQENSYY